MQKINESKKQHQVTYSILRPLKKQQQATYSILRTIFYTPFVHTDTLGLGRYTSFRRTS